MKDTPKSTSGGNLPGNLISEKEFAPLIGAKVETLRVQRSRGTSPIPYYKFGKSVRYDPKDAIAYRESCRVVPKEVAY